MTAIYQRLIRTYRIDSYKISIYYMDGMHDDSLLYRAEIKGPPYDASCFAESIPELEGKVEKKVSLLKRMLAMMKAYSDDYRLDENDYWIYTE